MRMNLYSYRVAPLPQGQPVTRPLITFGAASASSSSKNPNSATLRTQRLLELIRKNLERFRVAFLRLFVNWIQNPLLAFGRTVGLVKSVAKTSQKPATPPPQQQPQVPKPTTPSPQTPKPNTPPPKPPPKPPTPLAVFTEAELLQTGFTKLAATDSKLFGMGDLVLRQNNGASCHLVALLSAMLHSPQRDAILSRFTFLYNATTKEYVVKLPTATHFVKIPESKLQQDAQGNTKKDKNILGPELIEEAYYLTFPDVDRNSNQVAEDTVVKLFSPAAQTGFVDVEDLESMNETQWKEYLTGTPEAPHLAVAVKRAANGEFLEGHFYSAFLSQSNHGELCIANPIHSNYRAQTLRFDMATGLIKNLNDLTDSELLEYGKFVKYSELEVSEFEKRKDIVQEWATACFEDWNSITPILMGQVFDSRAYSDSDTVKLIEKFQSRLNEEKKGNPLSEPRKILALQQLLGRTTSTREKKKLIKQLEECIQSLNSHCEDWYKLCQSMGNQQLLTQGEQTRKARVALSKDVKQAQQQAQHAVENGVHQFSQSCVFEDGNLSVDVRRDLQASVQANLKHADLFVYIPYTIGSGTSA